MQCKNHERIKEGGALVMNSGVFLRRIAAILLILITFFSLAFADAVQIGPDGEYTLPPGRYTVGEDIPAGYYDIRIKGLDEYCTIRYSIQENLDGTLYMDSVNAFEMTFRSNSNYWQGCHPNILLVDYSFLEIENSYCVFYPITRQEF